MALVGFEDLKALDVNFEFYIGDIFSDDFIVRLDDGSALDLLDSTVSTKMEISEFTTPIALISQITDAAHGMVNIGITNTATIRAGRYGYSSILTTNTGTKHIIAEGFISVRLR